MGAMRLLGCTCREEGYGCQLVQCVCIIHGLCADPALVRRISVDSIAVQSGGGGHECEAASASEWSVPWGLATGPPVTATLLEGSSISSIVIHVSGSRLGWVWGQGECDALWGPMASTATHLMPGTDCSCSHPRVSRGVSVHGRSDTVEHGWSTPVLSVGEPGARVACTAGLGAWALGDCL